MRSRVLSIIGFIILIGMAIQGIFGIAAGVLISAIIGLGYGIYKKDKPFIQWSAIALILDVICIGLFCIGLQNM